MASFLARTAGLGSNPPVANALTARTAQDAAQLGGQPASYYQPAGQPIAVATNATNASNALQLGGFPADNYVRRGAADLAVLNNDYSTVGPLPRTFHATSHGGTLLLFLSGTAYGTAAGAIGVDVALDGVVIARMTVSINETLSHKTLVPVVVAKKVPAGDHTVTFATSPAFAATGTDGYDVYDLTVLELPIP